MHYQAVIFDLYGTLIRSFTRQEYDQVNAQMSGVLGVPYGDFWNLVAETFDDMASGSYRTFADNLRDICRRAGVETSVSQIEQAVEFRYQFTRRVLTPDPEVLEALEVLKSRGLKLGIITNCAPDVPELWGESPMRELIWTLRSSHRKKACRSRTFISIASPTVGLRYRQSDACT